MLSGVTRRWEACLESYADMTEPTRTLGRFVAETMYREATGQLGRKDE